MQKEVSYEELKTISKRIIKTVLDENEIIEKDENGKYKKPLLEIVFGEKDKGFTTAKTELISPEGKVLMRDDKLIENYPEVKITTVIRK